MISAPIQFNYDQNIGIDDQGERYLTNIQPVIPVDTGKDWIAISRTILPIISQDNVTPFNRSESGIGDIVQSVFFSPKAKADSGWLWGVGPVLILPTASKDELGPKNGELALR